MYLLNKLGNVSQFMKDEVSDLVKVFGIGYFGACILLLIHLSESEQLKLLPYDLNQLPYVKTNYRIEGLFEYFFSLHSDFPYHIEVGGQAMDDQLAWLGGITAYSFSVIRFLICKFIQSMQPVLHVENSKASYVIEVLLFYVLPMVLYAFILPPILIPCVAFCTSILGSFFQPGKKAWVYVFAFIINFAKYEDLPILTKLPFNFIWYFINIIYGFISTFLIMPIVWAGTSVSVWIYVIVLWLGLPFFITNGWNSIYKEIANHKKGLSIIFMIYTVISAFKYLTPQVAYGIAATFIFIIFCAQCSFAPIKF
jgi:hypothetical protein